MNADAIFFMWWAFFLRDTEEICAQYTSSIYLVNIPRWGKKFLHIRKLFHVFPLRITTTTTAMIMMTMKKKGTKKENNKRKTRRNTTKTLRGGHGCIRQQPAQPNHTSRASGRAVPEFVRVGSGPRQSWGLAVEGTSGEGGFWRSRTKELGKRV